MSVERNLEVVKKGYAAFAAGDAAGAMADMADDIVWSVPGESSISGTYRGKQEVGGFWASLASEGFTTEPTAFFADGDTVVVLTKATAKGKSSEQVDILTLRDAKMVEFRSVSDTLLQQQVWGTK